MRVLLRSFACAFFVIASACSSSSEAGAPAGSSCTSSASCGGGVCVRSADFPNGYCSTGCDLANPASCPSGSVCIDDASGAPADAGVKAICYQSCTQASQCQAGLGCSEKSSKMVCRAAR